MTSPRRIRVITYLVLAAIITLLFLSHSGNPNSQAPQDFYTKTANAMNRQHAAAGQAGQKPFADHGVDAGEDRDEDDDALSRQLVDRLRQAEQEAKENAQAKGPNKPETPEEVVGVGSSAQGQDRPAPVEKAQKEPEETQQDHEVEAELNSILKRSPVIIFSKSYCPFSKMAKGILLEKYIIEPTPFVVELDQHPLGARIQATLGEMTGRRTVPNVMIYGQSIGGGDEISALDREKVLAEKIASLGQGRISVSLRFAQSAQNAG
ncbi:hypothetical protein VTH06DRAFT_2680 [Thermothelomyces fergusii]